MDWTPRIFGCCYEFDIFKKLASVKKCFSFGKSSLHDGKEALTKIHANRKGLFYSTIGRFEK